MAKRGAISYGFGGSDRAGRDREGVAASFTGRPAGGSEPSRAYRAVGRLDSRTVDGLHALCAFALSQRPLAVAHTMVEDERHTENLQ